MNNRNNGMALKKYKSVDIARKLKNKGNKQWRKPNALSEWSSDLVSACHRGNWSYGSWDRIPPGYRALVNKQKVFFLHVFIRKIRKIFVRKNADSPKYVHFQPVWKKLKCQYLRSKASR
jgi:hypothetical protein